MLAITNQTSAFVYLIDSIAELLPELIMTFSQDGITVNQTASSSAILVAVKLHGESFDKYETEAPITLKVQTQLLLTVLRTSNITDTLCLQYKHANKNQIGISLTHSLRDGIERHYEIPVCPLQPVDIFQNSAVDDSQFRMVAHMNTKQLAHIMGNLLPFTSYIKIDASPASVVFSFNDNAIVSKGRIEVGGKRGRLVSSYEDSARGLGAKCSSIFLASAFGLFAKCVSLHPVCNLYLADDYPLMLEILINELGKLKLYLVPVDQT